MAGLNEVRIIGYVGQDPELRSTPNGDLVCNFSVATSEEWTDKISGEKMKHTEWHRVVLFRGLAEVAKNYLRKGSQVFVSGKLKTNKWTDANGIERAIVQIQGDNLILLGGNQSRGPVSTQPQNASGVPDSDIPF